MEVSADRINWGLDNLGAFVPRATPLDINYPTENQVDNGVVYGYEDQYLGTSGGGGISPSPPTSFTVSDNRDGSTATATISGTDQPTFVNEVYGWLQTGGYMSLTLLGSRVGDGDITITASANNYQAVCVTQNNGNYSLPTNPFAFSISSDYDFQIRDNTARTAVHILMHSALGDQVIFQNGAGEDPYTLWAKIEDGDAVIRLRNGSLTGEQSLTLIIPRQANFPPGETQDVWKPTATITYNGEVYEIDSVRPGNGIPKISADFRIECSRSKSGTF